MNGIEKAIAALEQKILVLQLALGELKEAAGSEDQAPAPKKRGRKKKAGLPEPVEQPKVPF